MPLPGGNWELVQEGDTIVCQVVLNKIIDPYYIGDDKK
jgi:hypothetical protein